MRRCLISLATALGFLPGLFPISLNCQSFTNLNFEAAQLPVSPPGQESIVSASEAFPGWIATIGGVEQSQVFYNCIPLGGTSITLLNANPRLGVSAIEGRFSLVLHSGGGPDLSTVSLSQTGLVPGDALSIQAAVQTSVNLFAFSLNGNTIPMYPINVTPSYTLYGGDVSAYAGQLATLSISALPSPSFGYAATFDTIRFSPVPVPEPSVVALAAISGLLLGVRRWRISRRK